jgi:hypothetical protein
MFRLFEKLVNDLLLYLTATAKSSWDILVVSQSQGIVKCRDGQLSGAEEAVSGEKGDILTCGNVLYERLRFCRYTA